MLKRFLLNNVNKYVSRWVVLTIDLVLVMNTFVFAYLIRFNFSFDFNTQAFLYQQPLVAFLALVSFIIIGSYKGIIRHTGIKDAINVFKASTLLAVLSTSVIFLNRTFGLVPEFTIPMSIIVLHYLLNVFILITSRYIFKVLYMRVISDLKPNTNILIYGAGDSGLITHSALVKDTSHHFDVIGFIDDNPSKVGMTIDGVMVYPTTVLTREFILKNKLREVIVSIQNIQPSRLMQITDDLLVYNIKVKIVPKVDLWIDGELNISQIKQVKIEDLLNRTIISIDNPIIQKEVNNKVIVVTGAAGSIGSEISRQLSTYNCKHLVLIDQAESYLYDLQQEFLQKGTLNFTVIVADVRDARRMEAVFKEFKPQKVFHAAAYKHVPLMEENPYEAIKTNIGGTKTIADLSLAYHVERFVMISTDKAVNPTNVMGATKRVAEMYISYLNKLNTKTKFSITRFGNVLGSNGSVFPLFKKQIENGGPILVTHKDITRYFMTIPEACSLVLEAGSMGEGGEIYIFDMGKPIKIYDVAIKMIQLSGLRFPEDIDIKITGLRPGEKLYEELLASDEDTVPTYHDKIMIAKVSTIDYTKVKAQIMELCHINKEGDNVQIVRLLKDLVPEYISSNSVFVKLDNVKLE
jgi:FlaA1/EpsC-like NDP-sugar epimerase